MELVLIGSSNSRRINFTVEALKKSGITNFSFISYNNILNNITDLSRELPLNGCIRLESPSEDTELEALLSGVNNFDQQPKGIIYDYSHWYSNYSDLLTDIEKAAHSKKCCFVNHPTSIAATFDKYCTKEILIKNQIPCTPLISKIADYEDLQNQLTSCKLNRAFLKPRYGSSASGVLAFSRNQKGMSVTSSVEMTNSLLFNNLKMHKYNSPNEIQLLINELGKFGLIAEKWVPKNLLGGKAFDLRIFVVNKKVRHIIVRTSNSSITNLHLGNKRGNLESISEQYPQASLSYIKQVAINAVNCFPGLFYAGVDVILSGQKCKPYVVEVNCFGDMLIGDMCEGKTTYEWFAKEFKNAYLSHGSQKN
jgi:glutathione synthase/RimK-type ligase-like ATP-grasp enzyme